MPELPEVVTYIECLKPRILGAHLLKARIRSFFLVRTAEPPLSRVEGRRVREILRIGKRIVLGMEEDLFLVFHLMIAGRFRWVREGAGIPGKIGLAAFDFPAGTLLLTEASTRKRASLFVVEGREGLRHHDRGGVEPLTCDLGAFSRAITRENRTTKRALTDPRILSGIGNAYSDEILHRARLSPFKLTTKLSDAERRDLFEATRAVLTEWTERLLAEAGEGFPTKVTAFKKGMAVHGRYREPCPVCEAPVQRIVYAESEMNYCARCQTGGRLLADRSLSKLLKSDWPRTLDDLE